MNVHKDIISKYANKEIIDLYNNSHKENISVNTEEWLPNNMYCHEFRNKFGVVLYWNITGIKSPDKPSVIAINTGRYENGMKTVVNEHWHKDGKHHNDNGPAIIITIIEGDKKTIIKKWYNNGELFDTIVI